MTISQKYIRYTNILFSIYVISLLGCCIFFYYRIIALEDMFGRVSHTIEVKLKLEKTLSNIRDAETAQRGYLLTQDSLFLEHYQEAQIAAFEGLENTKVLTADNIIQQKNTEHLTALTKERFASLAKTLQIQAMSPDKHIKADRLLNGRRVMSEIRELTTEMTQYEDDLLKERENQRDKALELTPIYALGILIFSLLIVVGCYILMARYTYQKLKTI